MKRNTRLGSSLVAVGLASFAALGGCASVVDGATSDAAVVDAGNDAAVDTGTDAAVGTCPNWVLTDREHTMRGEIYTDRHSTFDAAGQLQRVREHVRTGGHGIDRTFREFVYQWSTTGLTIEQVDTPGEREIYVLEGDNVLRRTRESAIASQNRSTEYIRDAGGRVIERVVMTSTATTSCGYAYDDAGHLLQADCDDGDLSSYLWDGDLLLRRDRSWRGQYRGFAAFVWNGGRLASESHDDGYGPNRGYRYDYVYDAENRVVRVDSSNALAPTPRPAKLFTYDSLGRLERSEWGYDDTGVPRMVDVWERDENGRPARLSSGDGTARVRFTYETSPSQVLVTMSGESGDRTSWRYACFQTPVRVQPAEPTIDVGVAAPTPQVEHYPVARLAY